MAISAPGIGSNLDVNSIVSQLMSIEQQPLMTLARREASFQAKVSAMGNLKSALSSFQNAVRSISDVTKFQGLKISSSDPTVVSATSTAIAVPGAYSLEVSKLAQAQKLVSVGQVSSSTEIGRGTITFDFGTISGGIFDSATGKYTNAKFDSTGSGTKTVTVEGGNASLSGIADAINKANIGVKASIVNDGGTAPYRLVLSQTNTGKANSLKISVAGDDPLSALLIHDPTADPLANPTKQRLEETVSAQNAEFKVDGILVSKSTNSVSDVIQGVTLNLAKTNAGSPSTLSIARDASTVTGSIGQFVAAYNQINQTLKDVSSFNAATKQGAVLNGDATVRNIQTQIRGILSTVVSGNDGDFSRLSDLGITLQKDGTLALEGSKLQKAIDTNFSGIAGLFAAVGKGTDSLVSFSGASTKTVAGSYALAVSQPATQGSITGREVAKLTIDAQNKSLQVQLNGVTADIELTEGSYTSAAKLAAELQSKINSVPAFSSAGSSVKVTASEGKLSISSNLFGSASNVKIGGSDRVADLIGPDPAIVVGLDVAGSFNGVTAKGSGQVLTGEAGSPAEGLSVQVTGGLAGNRGNVNYSQGYAYQFDRLLSSLLESNGPINSRTEGLNTSVKSLTQQKQRISERLVDTEKRYRAQFAALDLALASMTKTSSFLQQQLSNLPKFE